MKSRVIASEATGLSPVRRTRALPAKQGENQEYIDLFSPIDTPYRISSAPKTYMHTCLLRATISPLYENRCLTVGLVQIRLRQSPAEC